MSSPDSSDAGSSDSNATLLPFRERNILRLELKYLDLSPIPAKGFLQPHVNNLPRRRIVSDKTIRPASDTTVKPQVAPIKVVDYITRPEDETCLQELVPGLFVSFSKGCDEDGDNLTIRGALLTHLIIISPEAKETKPAGNITRTISRHGVQMLHLVVPKEPEDDGRTSLTRAQLEAARDSLSLAMPYSHHMATGVGEFSDIRILITAKNHRPVDVMSAAACYLAFESDNTAHMVLECINEEDDILPTWRGVISHDGIDMVEKVAIGDYGVATARYLPDV